jgi:hypothetical protein
MRYVAASGVVAALLLFGGCGNESAPDAGQEPTVSQPNDPTTQPSSPTPTPSATPNPTPTQSGSTSQGPIGQAKADLAERLGTTADQITLVSSEEVTWRDGSLGCPQPGMSYTQALIDGSRIILESGGKKYEYHAGGRRAPFLCTNPQPPLAGG